MAQQDLLAAVLGEALAAAVRDAAAETSPDEFVRTAVRRALDGAPTTCLEAIAATGDLLLGEQMQQGAYLAARLDQLELVCRSLLNLELQTDKRAHTALFETIHRSLVEQLNTRHLAL